MRVPWIEGKHMRIQSQLAVFWLLALGAGLMLEGCADPAPSGPVFEVSFDSSLARSNGGEPTRVELYLVDDCADVPMGTRSVDATAETVIVRDGSSGGFGRDVPLGDFGLYGVAQDDDCAIVAAGCTPVTITEDARTLAITLSRFDAPGCPVDQFCSRQTGECSSGTTPSRVTDGLLVLYDFDEGSGDTVFDQSDANPKLDLTIAEPGNVTWSPGYLSIEAGTQLESRRDARKLVSAIAPNNAMTMEAWVRPSTLVATGIAPDRIISMSDGSSNRNFLLGQDETEYTARYRTEGENNGNPTIRSTAGTASLNLTHVVFTHADDGTEVFYIDGEEDLTTSREGNTSTWDPSYSLVVANEVGGGREWLGELHLIAIYDRALDSEEVRQNFNAGP